MRKSILLVVFAMVLAACGGSGDPVAEAPGTVASSNAVEGTSGSAGSDASPSDDAEQESDSAAVSTESTTSTEASAPAFDGPPAPDFELALSDGSAFSLSAEQKPVYMVFWAEW